MKIVLGGLYKYGKREGKRWYVLDQVLEWGCHLLKQNYKWAYLSKVSWKCSWTLWERRVTTDYFSFPSFVCTCASPCVCTYIHVEGVCTHVHVRTEVKGQPQVLCFRISSSCFWRQSLFTRTWDSQTGLVWLAREHRDPPVSASPAPAL